jgi:hypothetical protein
MKAASCGEGDVMLFTANQVERMVNAVLSAHASMNADLVQRGRPPHRLTPASAAEAVATLLREGATPERVEVYKPDESRATGPLTWNVLGDSKVNRLP